MKCSDCRRYKTKKCHSNPSGEDHDCVENLTCFVPKDSKSIGQEKPHKAPIINIRTIFRLKISKISTVILLIANIVPIVFAVINRWDIGDVIWIYWAQSVIIGVFHIFLLMSLKQFSTDGYPGQPATFNSQYQAAAYFIFSYGLLHLAFFVFLKDIWTVLPSMSALILITSILLFLATHGFAYWEDRREILHRKPNLWTLTFYPFARVFPMWITLTLGINYAKGSLLILILFLILKTLADVIMHAVEYTKVFPPLLEEGPQR